jgi:acyl-CoA synthetase (AMP-forming)/AMP-acid ligase II
MVVAGAPPPSKTIERVESELGWEFIQIYGLTETSPLLTINRRRPSGTGSSRPSARGGSRARACRRSACAWRWTARARCWRARITSSRVLEAAEETAKAIVDGWFHTGDGGHEDGAFIVIADRKKDVIITGGENVSSIEVEDTLFQHPAVLETAVIGVPDEKWGETIKALVVIRPGHTATERELVEFCRGRMAHFKCPTSIEFRDSLLRTATGKLQKFKLREPYWKGRDRRVS